MNSNDMKLALGFDCNGRPVDPVTERTEIRQYLNLKLAANGLPVAEAAAGAQLVDLAQGLLTNFCEKNRLLDYRRCEIDRRIESFLNRYFEETLLNGEKLAIPGPAMVLDRHGLARELSFPPDCDEFANDYLRSYRARNGVLHNPHNDKRTTAGTFHVCEGGLAIPGDKRAVPKETFVELFRRAMDPPEDLQILPFTSRQNDKAMCWVSLVLRPMVCPEVRGFCPPKSMEVRFFAPGSLVSNLDFVESIFGNAGDPFVPMNDAALDVEHWTGHTGCVILAPHLTKLTKKSVYLPHHNGATTRQRMDRMCFQNNDELYNDGNAFKITCRDESGVMVTIIADNYYGYCKKEVKTQISFAANLMGNVEEEHAGGALVFPSWSVGDQIQVDSRRGNGRTFDDIANDYSQWVHAMPQGYGVDKHFDRLFYIPENARADLHSQEITWEKDGEPVKIPLRPGRVYMAPSGFKIRLEKHPAAPSWRIVGTAPEGTFCHKPCTVSGGGKSEISKSLIDYMQYGSVYVSDMESDFERVDDVFKKDYSKRWHPNIKDKHRYEHGPSRPVLSPLRTLGSVIKLLTPSAEYSDEYNRWLADIDSHVYALVFAIKRFYKLDWGDNWRHYFSVNFVNGGLGNELSFHNRPHDRTHGRPVVGTYLRVGTSPVHGGQIFKVRQDFAAATKVQTEDDISASIVVPRRFLSHLAEDSLGDADGSLSRKFVKNCEFRLFQRPDDAIHRGFDKQAEFDLAREGKNFMSNFEPLNRANVDAMLGKEIQFDKFTPPMKMLIEGVVGSESEYVVSSDQPRIVGGKPSNNPRYLQDRPDLLSPMDRYVAEMGTRFWRKISAGQPVHLPVNAILSGRRNNPPDKKHGYRNLAVYNPIHYQELPELFMDYICSLTGKSPSTTGAGSEGALTKGPFNSLIPTADLNSALVSMILTGLPGFSTVAGHVGPNASFEHDISLLVPEIWCRMSPAERDPETLIRERHLEQVKDFEYQGTTIRASRLGYRITSRFIHSFFGRVFDNPAKVFNKSVLEPESQDLDAFIEGIKNILEAQQKAAQQYFDDGSIENACPPLKALLTIMAVGQWNGKTERDPEVRSQFTRDSVLTSEWYHERLITKQQKDVRLWERHRDYLDLYLKERRNIAPIVRKTVEARQKIVADELDRLRRAEYLGELHGTLGAEPRLGINRGQQQ